MFRRSLIVAACVAIGAVVYLASVHVAAIERADVHTLAGFMGLASLPGAWAATWLVHLFDPAPFAILSGSLTLAAIAANRVKAGVAAFGLMLGANVTTQLLKPLLAVQRDYPAGHVMGPEAFPSGHTTAVMSFALALIIISPARLRPLAAAAGGLLTVATVYSILILGWHYPSDVIGGLLVATTWACAAGAALKADVRPSFSGPALAGTLLTAAAAFAVLARPADAVAYASANTTFVLGALAIAAATLALSGSAPAPRAARRDRSRRARG